MKTQRKKSKPPEALQRLDFSHAPGAEYLMASKEVMCSLPLFIDSSTEWTANVISEVIDHQATVSQERLRNRQTAGATKARV